MRSLVRHFGESVMAVASPSASAAALALAATLAAGLGCSGFDPGVPPEETGPFSFVDDANGFALGTQAGTKTSTGVLTLEDNVTDGTFLSQVFDAEAPAATWQQFEFVPSAPYGVGLPNDGVIESGYPGGNVDMSENVLLLHCDGLIDDTSPAQNTVTAVAQRFEDDGVVGQSCRVDAPSDLEVVLAENGLLNFGESDYTWAMWVRTLTDCAGNQVVMGANAQPEPGASHTWFGCARGPNQGCEGEEGGFFSGVHASQLGTDSIGFCSTTIINDGEWHHVAVVKSGHESVSITAYVDGEIEDFQEGSFQLPISFPPDDILGIGRYPGAGFDPTDSTEVDELAIWRRALSAEEIRTIFERGAFGVGLAVAVCSEPSCDGPFTNEIADPADIVDPGLGSPAAVDLELPTGRYFRYRVQMSNPFNLSRAPELRSVGVSGVR